MAKKAKKPRSRKKKPSQNGGVKPGVQNAKGQFIKGNPGGPGNPYAFNMAELRAAAFGVVKPENMANIFRAMIVLAEHGDIDAAKFISGYVLGKPDKEKDKLPRPQDLPEQLEFLFQRFADRPLEHWPPLLLQEYRRMHPEKFPRQVVAKVLEAPKPAAKS